ncbi:MAG TPA: response regulator [Nitrososphaeraceae archaeon]|nr:response regulator [Nitrososphaeraceae archaeon]
MILHKVTSLFHYFSGSENRSYQQDQKLDTATSKEKEARDSYQKRILIVDDEPDVTLTFKVGLEGYHCSRNDNETRFKAYTYNNPLEALSQFKPNFYDILLLDVYMPHMNGFQLCEKVLELDVDVRVCFMSAADLNIDALREVWPKVSFGCFIKKPVEVKYLIRRLLAEID